MLEGGIQRRGRRHEPKRHWGPANNGAYSGARGPYGVRPRTPPSRVNICQHRARTDSTRNPAFRQQRDPLRAVTSTARDLEALEPTPHAVGIGTKPDDRCRPPVMVNGTSIEETPTAASGIDLDHFLPKSGDHILTTWNVVRHDGDDHGHCPGTTAFSEWTGSCSTHSVPGFSGQETERWLAEVKCVSVASRGKCCGKIAWAQQGYSPGKPPPLGGSWDTFEGRDTDVEFVVTIDDGRPCRELRELITPDSNAISSDWMEWNPIDLAMLRSGAAFASEEIRRQEETKCRQDKAERELHEVRFRVAKLESLWESRFRHRSSAEKNSMQSPVSKDIANGIFWSCVPDLVLLMQSIYPPEYARAFDKKPSSSRIDAIGASKMALGDATGLNVVTASAVQLPIPGAPVAGLTCTMGQFQALTDFFVAGGSVNPLSKRTQWEATVRPGQEALHWASPDEEFALQFASYGSLCDALGISMKQRRLRLWPEFLESGDIPSLCLVGSVIVIRHKSGEQPGERVPLQRLIFLGQSWNGLLRRFKDGAMDHDVCYLQQEDVAYKAGAGCCESVFTRITSKVSELMRRLLSFTIIVDDNQLPLEIIWRPISQYERTQVQAYPSPAPGLLTVSLPIVFVRSGDLMKSATRLCDPSARGDGRPCTVHESRLHMEDVQAVVDTVTRAPVFANSAPPVSGEQQT